MGIYHRILLAVDLAETSESIGRKACELAAAMDARVELLHVFRPLPLVVPLPEPPPSNVLKAQAEWAGIVHESIESLARKLGIPDDAWRIVEGDTRAEIVRVARDRGIDLIVVGARERHALAFFVKPTEDAVLHDAPCDVLAVRVIRNDKSEK